MQIRRKLLDVCRMLIAVTCAAAVSGCSYFVKKTQDQLEQTANALEVTIPAVGTCTSGQLETWSTSLPGRSSTGAMSEAVKSLLEESTSRAQAARILSETLNQSPPKRELGKVLVAMLPVRPSGSSIDAADTSATTEVHISRAQLRHEMEEVAKTAQAGGFRRLSEATHEFIRNGQLSEHDVFAKAEFFARYFDYYFRQGHLLSFGIDRKAAETRLRKDLSRAMGRDYDKMNPGDQKVVDNAVMQMLAAICKDEKCQLWDLADDDTAFITRAGQKFAFPVITVNVAPGVAHGFEVTKIDEVAIVSDLTRVFVEAAFDTAQPNMPALDKATGCADQRNSALFKDCRVNADDELNAINKAGDIAEGIGGYVAAQAVRGAWLAALNNEAVAKLVSTMISVSARKGAELAVWTALRCHNDANTLTMRTVRFVADP